MTDYIPPSNLFGTFGARLEERGQFSYTSRADPQGAPVYWIRWNAPWPRVDFAAAGFIRNPRQPPKQPLSKGNLLLCLRVEPGQPIGWIYHEGTWHHIGTFERCTKEQMWILEDG